MIHLTDEQLADWLAGEASGEAQAHLEACPACKVEAFAMRDGISRYAVALRREAAKVALPAIAPARAIVVHRLRWAAVASLALILAVPSAWMLRPHPPTIAPQPVATAPQSPQMSDDELLDAVNNDLNRDVPQALAPVGEITYARNRMASQKMASQNAANSAKTTE